MFISSVGHACLAHAPRVMPGWSSVRRSAEPLASSVNPTINPWSLHAGANRNLRTAAEGSSHGATRRL